VPRQLFSLVDDIWLICGKQLHHKEIRVWRQGDRNIEGKGQRLNGIFILFYLLRIK
jgi:hypothetical protein